MRPVGARRMDRGAGAIPQFGGGSGGHFRDWRLRPNGHANPHRSPDGVNHRYGKWAAGELPRSCLLLRIPGFWIFCRSALLRHEPVDSCDCSTRALAEFGVAEPTGNADADVGVRNAAEPTGTKPMIVGSLAHDGDAKLLATLRNRPGPESAPQRIAAPCPRRNNGTHGVVRRYPTG